MYSLLIILTFCKIFLVLSKTNLLCLFQGGPKPRNTAVVADDKENSSPESEPSKDADTATAAAATSKPDEATPSCEITVAL